MKKNKIVAMAILSAIAFNASAAPNINNILNQVFSSSGSSDSTSSDSNKKRSTGDKNVDQVLTKYGSIGKQGAAIIDYSLQGPLGEGKIVSTCSKGMLDIGHKMLSDNMKSDPKYSLEVAKSNLSYSSQCALLEEKYEYKDSVAQSDFVYSSGYFLAVDAILSKDMEKKTDAETLLSHVNGPGDSMIKFMNKSFGLNAPVKSSADFSGSAFAMVNARSANQFAFDQKYEGKVMEVTGKLNDIRGINDNNGVFLVVKGSNKGKDLINFSDFVQCQVTNPDEIKKTYSLKRGDQIKFKGIYEKKSLYLLVKDCGIID